MKAIWKGEIIAQSNETIIIENNHYFHAETVNKDFIEKIETHFLCPWKGEVSYYNIVNGQRNNDAVCYYS